MDKSLRFHFTGGMSETFFLPKCELSSVLDQLEVRLLVDPADIHRWNDLVCEHHYLKNANLVGEQLRYAVAFQGQWLALLGLKQASCDAGIAASEFCAKTGLSCAGIVKFCLAKQ